MSVYLHDTFQGTAGTALTSHTADSGATWPTDSSHKAGANAIELDGSGELFSSSGSASANISSATMPATQNFEVQYDLKRYSSVSGAYFGLTLLANYPGFADHYDFLCSDDGARPGLFFSHNGSTSSSIFSTTPANGVTWRIRIRLTTSGGNTLFSAAYSTNGGTTLTSMGIDWSVATPAIAINVGFWGTGTATTAATGVHAGNLLVQDLPPTTATITGPASGNISTQSTAFTVTLDRPAQYGGLTVTPASSVGADAFQATSGGGNVSTITIAEGTTTGTFYLTPVAPSGNRNVSVTSTPTATSSTPVVYNCIGVSNATGYTVTGPAGGHIHSPATYTVTLTPPGSTYIGAITATPTGSQLFYPFATNWFSTGVAQTFNFTPITPDTITWTCTNNNGLTDQSGLTYVATDLYLHDTFAESSRDLSAHTADSGSTWGSSGNIKLDGSGRTYLASSGDSQSLSAAAMPAAMPLEVQFDISRLTSVSSAFSNVVLMQDGSGNKLVMKYQEGAGFTLNLNGSDQSAGWNNGLGVGSTWRIKVDLSIYNQYTQIYTAYSTDGGATWNNLLGSQPFLIITMSMPAFPFSGGLLYQLTPSSPTTGVHIGNLTFRDPTPPSPTSRLSSAYVTSSGKSVSFFFKKISDSSAVIPTALNYAPAIYQNGNSIGYLVTSWTTGVHSCAVLCLQSGQQINTGDAITISAPASWMTTQTTAAEAVTNLAITNNTGMSCFGTDTLVKTFKPGLNFSHLGTSAGTLYNMPKNWRYRLEPSEAGSTNTVDGYPTAMYHPTEVMQFCYTNVGNGLDSTGEPGVPGYWAIGFDDLSYGTSSATALSIVSTDSHSTVSQVHSVDNTGSSGIGQFYMFNAQQTEGSTVAYMSLGLQLVNANRTPNITNLVIYGPGDFTYTIGVPLTLDRSDPYALSSVFLDRLHNGAGCFRWLDSVIGYANACNMSEPWELHKLTDFSWNNSNQVNYTFGYTSARPFTVGSSTYIYGDDLGSPFPATLSAPITNTTSTTITISDADTAPVFVGLLLLIGSEKMRVRSVTGASPTFTVTVERGSSGTTPATHSTGTIQVYSRKAITSLAQLGGINTLLPELVTQTPHGLKSSYQAVFDGTWPDFTFVSGATYNLSGATLTIFVTGANSFIVFCFAVSSSCTILSTTYTLTPSTNTTNYSEPPTGFPYEFAALTTGKFPGTNVHINIPMSATDSYCYKVAGIMLANFPAGRRVYVELGDEIWNTGFSENLTATLMGRVQGLGLDAYGWLIHRSGQIRTIFRNVFGSRADEIKIVLDVQYVGNSSGPLNQAVTQGVTIDALAVAPYFDPDNSDASIAAWNGADIQQRIDLWIHDLYCNTTGFFSFMSSHRTNIADYNAATGGNCELYGYEGGYQTGVPYRDSTHYANHYNEGTCDMAYDPLWYVAEQDIYGAFQKAGFTNVNLYSYCIYRSYTNLWGLYHSPYQPYGRGDGSDGKANNRHCLATPGLPYSKSPTTNQDQQNCSVRGQAFRDWMPATLRKKPKFVPFSRSVKRY
jgi:hypothetical protein